MADPNEPEFETVAETAAGLKVSEKHVRRLMKAGKIRYYMFGRAARIRRSDREEYAASCLIDKTV